ncbi:hypothetical protein J6590_083129 [Homalodisca vitripennis]|nr:hypothetical protein J6590_083129 [Homalodisca vitripennis]
MTSPHTREQQRYGNTASVIGLYRCGWKKLENEFAKWCRKRPNVFHFLAGKSVVQHQQSLKLDVELAACSPPS